MPTLEEAVAESKRRIEMLTAQLGNASGNPTDQSYQAMFDDDDDDSSDDDYEIDEPEGPPASWDERQVHGYMVALEEHLLNLASTLQRKGWSDSEAKHWQQDISQTMKKYARGFRRQYISGYALLALEDRDLEDMGVTHPFIRAQLSNCIKAMQQQ